MELNKCDLCENREFITRFSGNDYLSYSPLIFNVVECSKCGLVCLNPRPESLDEYYKMYRKNGDGKDYFLFLSPNRSKIIKKIKKPGKILDIGCGRGEFLFNMKKDLWDVYGCDISGEAYTWAKKEFGLENIYNNDILALDLPNNYFDVITLWHVLEHLPQPVDTLKKINQLLKDDGILIIESPNFSCLQSKIFKDKWFQLDLPRHLHQFTPEVLKKMLELSGLVIFKKDSAVNIRITFIDLKISILRYLRIENVPRKEETTNLKTETNYSKPGYFKKILGFIFNLICILFALVLISINSDSSFRVYCRKIKK